MPFITVEHQLTEEEINERAKEMAHKMRERDKVENAKKSSNKAFSDELKDYDRELDRLAKAIDTGKEDKEVDCIIEKDYDNKVIRYVDSITNEVVREVVMGPSDAQLSMQEDIENAENPEADIDDLVAAVQEELDEQNASAIAAECDDDDSDADEDEFSAATAAVGF